VRLRVLVPTGVIVDEPVRKVVAEAVDGELGVYGRHVDFVAPLVAGILSYESGEGEERFLAVDEGIFVKCGSEVLVSSKDAVRGPHLGRLRQTVEEEYRRLNTEQKKVRSAVAKLEADLARRFLELEAHGEG
jgi:F-type H+-transporting ATPase subunit epsilon